MDYLQFKAELEMMGISTFENDELVLKLYKLYLKEDKNDYRKAIGRCLKFLSETDEQNAEANANVKYLDRLLKRKKALYITGETSLKSVSAKEQAFYASDTYKNAGEELFQAEVKASTLENKRDKEGLIIDLFRTLEASRRKHNI